MSLKSSLEPHTTRLTVPSPGDEISRGKRHGCLALRVGYGDS